MEAKLGTLYCHSCIVFQLQGVRNSIKGDPSVSLAQIMWPTFEVTEWENMVS